MLVPADSRAFFEPCEEPGYTLCHVSYWIWRTVPFLLMAIGTCGNLLSIAVLSRRRLRAVSTSMYLLFLAGSDLSLLWSATLREILMFVFRLDISSLSKFSCVTIFWILYTSSGLSVWILVFLTIERVLFTKFPIFAKRHMTRKHAFIVCVSILVGVSMISSHVLFEQTLIETTSGNLTITKCVASDQSYAYFSKNIWPYIMFTIYTLLPMIIIFTGNMVILFSLKQRRKVHAHLQAQQNVGASDRTDKEARATRLLFILSFFFLFTSTPFTVFGIVYMSIYRDLDDRQFAGIQLTYVIVKILIWSNFTFNFFFYFINGSLFKREWNSLVREIKKLLGLGNSSQSNVEIATVVTRDASITNDARGE